MKKKLLLLTAVCIALGAKAQDKYDYQWFLGYAALDIAKKYGTTVLDFHQNPVQLYTDKLRNNRTRTTAQICDKNGKMQFVSNGCKMINAQGQLIENGDSLNYPGKEWDRSCQWEYRTFPGMVALPYPGRDNYYCVFHYRYDWQGAFSPSVYTPESLLCTEIDMSANAGLGRVTRKNVPLQKDTFADNFAAVRHGNGRDWWVASFRSSPDKDRMFLYLLTPEGVKGPFERRTGLTWYIAPPFYSLSSAVFSPSGNRYARVHWGNDLQLFRFDRCAGTFGEAQRIRFPGDTISPGGVAFSPNGRFVYVSARERLYQVDCEASPPQQSVLLIGTYDGFKSFYNLATNFYQMRLAPDGKIYMTANNGVDYLHVIHNPNAKGAACNFQQHGLELPTHNGACFPIAPNFRLYDLPGSPCDTLGISATEAPYHDPGRWHIFPSPAQERATLWPPAGFEGELRVFNAAGLQMATLRGIGPAQPYGTVEVWDWPPGVYFVQAIGKEGTARAGSFVVGR